MTPASAQKKKATPDLQKAAEKAFYPLTGQSVSSNPLDGKMGPTIDVTAKGRLIRVCCKNCVEEVNDNADRIIARIDRAHKRLQRASYPLATCVVSGKKLGTMGKPHELLHGVRLVRLCCKGCVDAFTKEPARYMRKLDKAAMDAQRERYPLQTCLVGGGKLGSMGDPYEFMFGPRLIRMCCKGCLGKFAKDPAGFLAKLQPKKQATGKHLGVFIVEGMT